MKKSAPRAAIVRDDYFPANPMRVSRNVKAVLESDYSPAQVAVFGELVNQESPPIVAPA